jgi:hypothetical protein
VEDIAPRAHDVENGSKNRRNGKAPSQEGNSVGEPRVLALPARGEADEIAALMLAQLLNARGISTRPISSGALASERLEEASGEHIEVVCVATVVPDGCLHTRYLCKRLHEQFPEMRIVAAILVREEMQDARNRELCATANEVAGTLTEAAQQVQALVAVPSVPSAQTAFSL